MLNKLYICRSCCSTAADVAVEWDASMIVSVSGSSSNWQPGNGGGLGAIGRALATEHDLVRVISGSLSGKRSCGPTSAAKLNAASMGAVVALAALSISGRWTPRQSCVACGPHGGKGMYIGSGISASAQGPSDSVTQTE